MPRAPYLVFHYEKSTIRTWWEVVSAPMSPVEVAPLFTIWVQNYWPEYSFRTLLQTAESVLSGEKDIGATDPLLTPEILAILDPMLRGSRLKMSVTTLTISMAMMQELDALMAEKSIREQFDILSQIIGKAHYWWKTHAIGVDFSEVFWVEPGQTPPAHYRPNVDRLVRTLAEYQHQTAKFSYQLAKAIFTLPTDYLPIVTKSIIFPYIYSGWEERSSPVHTFENNDLSHILEVKRFLQDKNGQNALVLRLGPQINLDDLQYCYSHFMHSTKLREVTFLLSGTHYAEADQREQVLQTMIRLATQYHWRFFPHIFLLTQPCQVSVIDELEPEIIEQSGFRALKQDRGYYLSDPRVFEAVYRNLQDLSARQSVVLKELFVDTQESSRQRQSTYIIQEGLPTEQYRKSKRFNAQQLKEQLTVTVTQQYAQTREVTQNQTLQQQQDLNQQQELSQTQAHQQQRQEQMGIELFRSTVSFNEFSNKLLDSAMTYQTNPDAQTKLLRDNGYYTEHHRKTNLMMRLASDSEFRLKVTATIFGCFGCYAHLSGLGKHSFVQIDRVIAEYLLLKIPHIVDGLEPNSLVLEEGFYSIMMSPLYRFRTLIGYSDTSFNSSRPTPYFTTFFKKTSCNQFQSVIQVGALLRQEDMAAIEHSERRNTLHKVLQTLLSVFESTCPQALQNEGLFRRYLRILYRLHCPNEDLTAFNRFLDSFHSLKRDHCKIMLYPILIGYSAEAEQFLLLVKELEKRALLDHFRKIYFENGLTVDVVADLLQVEKRGGQIIDEKRMSSTSCFTSIENLPIPRPLFLSVAQTTPIGADPAAWPPFEKFCHHFLLYTSKQNIDTQFICLKNMQKFWQRIDAKMFRYYKEDRVAVESSMRMFVANLICPEQGFVIAPVGLAKTILDGLEEKIESAIQHDMLSEQLQEWNNLSLLHTDAVYAGLHDDYGVVTEEMGIELSKLWPMRVKGDTHHFSDSYKTSYRVTTQEIKRLLDEQCIVDQVSYSTFLIKIFRYLGCQSLREPIAFYRQLHQFKNQSTDPVYVYFRHMLLGYFVLNKTGAHYTQDRDPKALYQDFLAYLLQKNYTPPNNYDVPQNELARTQENATQVMHTKIRGEFHGIILACVQDFCQGLNTIKLENTENKHYSLWGFYQKYRLEDSTVEKSLAWIGVQLAPSFETIPSIFKKKFSIHSLSKFFLVHQEALKKSSYIFNQYPTILMGLIVAKMRETFAVTMANKKSSIPDQALRARKYILYHWLECVFPQMSIEQFIHNLVDLETLVSSFSDWALSDDYALLAEPVTKLLGRHNKLKTGQQILQLIEQQRHTESYQSEQMQLFLDALTEVPHLVASEEHFQALLPVLCTAYMTNPKPYWLIRLLHVSQQLLSVEASVAGKTLKTLLLHCQQENPPFFLVEPLSYQQLQGLVAILQDKSVDLSLLKAIWCEDPETDFSTVEEIFKTCDAEQSAALSQLALYLYHANSSTPMVQILTQCGFHPKTDLLLLARLVTLYQIDEVRIRLMVRHSNLKLGIKHLETELYAENLERFAYDRQDIAQKIAAIRKKSMTEGEDDTPLPPAEQEKLLKDYERMMSYMLEHPVFMVENGEGEPQALTIQKLDEDQCKKLYDLISKKLRDRAVSAEKKHAYRLTLLALSCEAHYRTTKKFPQNTQILCELHGLDDPDCTIQEVKTGGGKSIISEVRAVLLCAEGWTVDIATENIALAETALRKFKLFYDYLGVACGKDVILPDSSRSAYIEGGIHHATPANFSFYRANMALKKKTFPTRVALLCDEIDAVLTTTIQYRLAGVLDPIYTDLTSWAVVLTELLAFVREEAIFLHNNCDAEDDVHNFRTYFSRKNADKKLTQFVEKIPQETLNMLLNSARIPEALQGGVDYLSILRQHKKKMEQYAAPILNVGTKRPEPSVSYSEGGQQLLHTFLNAILAKGETAYGLEAITETIMVISAKNFFDFYPLVIGWTGTPGAKNELREFSQENRLQAYYYPTFHPDLSDNLGTVIVETRAQQHAAVLARIREEREKKPGQPILLDADSPKTVAELFEYLQASAPDLHLQSYTGFEDSGLSEEDIVERAGQDNRVTITTLSLTRGTDFESLYAQGICAINTAADITECDATQLEGRVARNGKPGQFCHIICAEDLTPATAALSDPIVRFKAHQLSISLKRQQERLKTRFLEDIRYHVVTKYFLGLRQAVDRILAGQQGIYASLIAEKVFLETLRDFNKHSEQAYTELLGAQTELSPEQKVAFMGELVGLYQRSLDKLIADRDLQQFQAIEPLIALEQLQTAPLPEQVKLQDLNAVSEILSSGWRVAGNQLMVPFWAASEDVLAEFQPYFDGECSIRVATAQTLERREILKIPKVVAEIDHLKEIIQDFAWNDAIENVQRGVVESTDDRVMKALGSMISQIFSTDMIGQCKEFALQYLEETKTQIAQKRWDDLALPNFNVPWIQTWLSRISTIFSAFAWITYGSAFVAGPIPFIISRFVLPTVLSWIKTLVKRWFADSESTMVQVLIGLDDAFGDVSKLVEVLFKKDLKTMTIDDLLKEIAPVFKNKAIQLLINKMFESPDTGATIFQLLPDLMTALEPYRHLPCTELKNPEIMMTIFIRMLQSDAVKQLMDPEEHGHIVQKIQALPLGFSEAFKDCTLPQLLGIIKALAHPRFNEFLKQLPPESDLSELVLWLRTETDAVPDAIQNPLRKLRDYQDNHERIAQESQAAYRNIKNKFTLRIEDLQAYESNLHRQEIIAPPAPTQTMWMVILNMQLTQLIISYTLLLLANYMLFGFSLLLVTGVFAVLFVAPILFQMYLNMLKEASADRFPNDVISPFVWSKSLNMGEAVLPELQSPIRAPQVEPQDLVITPQFSSAYQIWSMFGTAIPAPFKTLDLSRVMPNLF